MDGDPKTDGELAAKRLSDPDPFEDCIALARIWRKLEPNVSISRMFDQAHRNTSSYENLAIRNWIEKVVNTKRRARLLEHVNTRVDLPGEIEKLEHMLEIEL